MPVAYTNLSKHKTGYYFNSFVHELRVRACARARKDGTETHKNARTLIC